MRNSVECDPFDVKLLTALQADGSLSNQALSKVVNLSPSQCSRRRARLEAAGLITGYRAILAPGLLGFDIVALVGVRLATHTPGSAGQFHSLIARHHEIRDAYSLTGDMDYQLRVVTRDLKALSDFISVALLSHDSVQTVHSTIVLDTLKAVGGLPLEILQGAVFSKKHG